MIEPTFIRHTSPDQMLEAIEDTIREAVKQAQAKGIKIVSGRWGDHGEECCPLGALDAVRPKGDLASRVCMSALGISRSQRDNFIAGFDGRFRTAYQSGMYDMGRRLRKEFIG